jgi:hypothetical protein
LKWRGKAEGRAPEHRPQAGEARPRAAAQPRPNVETPEAGAALLELLRDGKGELKIINAALLWTASFPRHAVTAELWRVLLQKYAGHQQVRQIAIEWVWEFPELPLVAKMLAMQARTLRNDPEFAEAVCGWLAAHPENGQTPELLELLAASRLENVRRQLAHWLDAHPRHAASAQLLAACLAAGALDADWLQRAENFLEHSGHPDALRPLRALLATKADEKIISLALTWLPKAPAAEQPQMARWLGNVAANQPETAGMLLNALRGHADWSEEFFDALAARLLDKRSTIQQEWRQRGFDALDDAAAQKLFAHMLEKTSPLPQPLSQALAGWLQKNPARPVYRQAVEMLCRHPEQGHYFRSASMLPLKLLADILKP